MDKLSKKYVIGTHVMFFEIEMYKDFIDGLVNLLETVENLGNVTIDICFNTSELIEKIDNNEIVCQNCFIKLEIYPMDNVYSLCFYDISTFRN